MISVNLLLTKVITYQFQEIIGDRIRNQIDVEYVFQELEDLPEGFKVPKGRKKPWGDKTSGLML